MNTTSLQNMYELHKDIINGIDSDQTNGPREDRSNGINSYYAKDLIYLCENINKLNENNFTIRKTLHKLDLVNTVIFLKDLYNSNKKALKMVNIILSLDDTGIDERTIGLGRGCNRNVRRSYLFREYFKLFNYSQMSVLLNLIKEKGHSTHNFVSNLHKIAKHNLENENFVNEAYEFIKFILVNFNFTNIVRVLPFINYAKIRNSRSFDEMNNHINKIMASKRGIVDSKAVESNMLINLPFDDRFFFTKDAGEISTIGSRTHCCFRKGGAAESLLKPALYSPISGIIEGKFVDKTWFSFVWEIVEFNEENQCFEICLILDNLESSQCLNDYEWEFIMKKLKSLKKYKRIYLGYMRNDIPTLPKDIQNTLKERYRRLIAYENEFGKYGSYDDSKQVYTLIENEDDCDINIRKMDKGDLHRCKYVEELIWENPDDDLFKLDITTSPSYVISNFTTIYGYLMTRLIFQDKETGEIFLNKAKRNKYLREQGEDYPRENIIKILYIEDLFLTSNKKIIKTMDNIIDNIRDFMKENNITHFSASFNKYSKPFKKRLKDEGITFLNDDRFGDSPMLPDEEKLEKFRHPKIDFSKITIYDCIN